MKLTIRFSLLTIAFLATSGCNTSEPQGDRVGDGMRARFAQEASSGAEETPSCADKKFADQRRCKEKYGNDEDPSAENQCNIGAVTTFCLCAHWGKPPSVIATCIGKEIMFGRWRKK